jgi:hypothetical protein
MKRQVEVSTRKKRYARFGLVEFENTPKALANFSPAVGAQRQPWESNYKHRN